MLLRRPRRPRPRGESAIWARLSRRLNSASEAKHLPEKRGLTNTLKGDPRPMESRAIARVADRKAVAPKGHASGRATPIKGLFGDNSRKPHRARGWESQEPPLGRANNANAAAPDGGTHNQGLIGDSSRNIPHRARVEVLSFLSRFARRLRAPEVRFPFAFISPPHAAAPKANAQVGINGGLLSHGGLWRGGGV